MAHAVGRLFAMKMVAACAMSIGAMASFDAQADIWSYVDERGVAHFASSQMDARYELFFRGRSNLDPLPDAAANDPQLPPLQSATPRLLAFIESSPGFKSAQRHVQAAADTYRVDYALLKAVIATESGFDTDAVSPKGAVGLMQVMPATGERYGLVDDRYGPIARKLTDPRTNINTGTRYLRDLIQMFPNRLELAVAAYNAGEGAVQKAGNQIPNFRETQNYVKTVLQLYEALRPPSDKPPVANGRVRAVLPGPGYGRGNMVRSLDGLNLGPAIPSTSIKPAEIPLGTGAR